MHKFWIRDEFDRPIILVGFIEEADRIKFASATLSPKDVFKRGEAHKRVDGRLKTQPIDANQPYTSKRSHIVFKRSDAKVAILDYLRRHARPESVTAKLCDTRFCQEVP